MTLETNEFDSKLLDVAFTFRKRPIFLPEDLRPLWRIGLILLLMQFTCIGSKTSRTKLHVLNWAVRTLDTQEQLLAVIQEKAAPNSLVVRFDPFLDKAIDLAIGEGLIKRIGGKSLQLSDSGKQYAKKIQGSSETYTFEKKFITTIGFKVTEDLINRIFRGRNN